jgi:hypothetical protein
MFNFKIPTLGTYLKITKDITTDRAFRKEVTVTATKAPNVLTRLNTT